MLPLIILLGSIISAVTLGFKSKKEGFAGMNFPMTFKPDGEVKSAMGPNFYSVPGTYQAALAPRFSNLDYGSQINFNFPPTRYLATPENPLSYQTPNGPLPRLGANNPKFQSASINGNGRAPMINARGPMQVKEGFCGEPQAGYTGPPPNFKFGDQTAGTLPMLPPMQGEYPLRDTYMSAQPQIRQVKEMFTPVRCNTNRAPQATFVSDAPYFSGYTTPPNFSETNYQAEKDKLCGSTFSSVVPSGAVTLRNDDGTVEQPIVYDRFVFANQRSYLQGQGDRIRGDLPILPNNTGWFQVAVNPTVDLTNSALGVMSGNGQTARELTALKTALMMNTQNTFGSMGNIDGSVQKQMMGSAAQGDISWTTFP